ncbi:MAG: hypothetical protein KC413_14720 [Anaerolineales bacterium]|nr:hypothetical protein [Anaerolineales bacterium]MCA9977011.1 hypothetical protein [Anaerolineales bacterium]MCB8989088.1 hypothetical protein [Ardenticatenaceae bacterium]MCB9418187.1 hypothetical protein [Ardenticatenaceae bacterium]
MVNKVKLLGSILGFALLLSLVLATGTQPVAAQTCDPNADLSGYIEFAGGQAIGHVNNAGSCTYNVGIAIYYAGANPLDYASYTFVDVATTTVGPSTTIAIDLPACSAKAILFHTLSFDPPPNLVDIIDGQYQIARKYQPGDVCTPPPPPPPVENPGTGTIGYWKTHPEAWPTDFITIGGIVYGKAEAIDIMGQPTRGDKTYNMYEQLVAAKLNVMIGNDDSCIAGTIDAADAWMADNHVGSGVRANSAAWSVGGPWMTTLDNYNNGLMCAPHRD